MPLFRANKRSATKEKESNSPKRSLYERMVPWLAANSFAQSICLSDGRWVTAGATPELLIERLRPLALMQFCCNRYGGPFFCAKIGRRTERCRSG